MVSIERSLRYSLLVRIQIKDHILLIVKGHLFVTMKVGESMKDRIFMIIKDHTFMTM
jgi:hypothetical protein